MAKRRKWIKPVDTFNINVLHSIKIEGHNLDLSSVEGRTYFHSATETEVNILKRVRKQTVNNGAILTGLELTLGEGL